MTATTAFTQLLNRSAASLAPENLAAFDFPSDELHQEILLPLLPALLGDKAIRAHWESQKSSGFFPRFEAHFDGHTTPPQWTAEDFAIHVTASYSADPDARALADTLLSEESLRDLTAALMNKVLARVWPELGLSAPSAAPPVPSAEPQEPVEMASLSLPIDPVTSPDQALDESLLSAETFADDSFVAAVHRSLLARPKLWNFRCNPLAAARSPIPRTLLNPLAQNPLEHRFSRSRNPAK